MAVDSVVQQRRSMANFSSMTRGVKPLTGPPEKQTNIAAYDWPDVVVIVNQRRLYDGPTLRRMQDIRLRYNGDVIIPLIDVSGEPTLPHPIPRLIAEGIDQTAMRAASTMPSIACPAVNSESLRSIERAAERRRALYSCWHASQLKMLLRRLYRHLVGYGTAAMICVPDFDRGRSLIELRDPLTAYPEPRVPEEIRKPRNVAFVYGRSYDWIRTYFPQAALIADRYPTANYQQGVWELVEWIDEDQIMVGLLGIRTVYTQSFDILATPNMLLGRWPNRAGIVTACVPRRVTLDRIQGQLQTIVGMEDLLGRLTSLDIVAAERAIFPDMVIIGESPKTPFVVGGKWMDGREGQVNTLVDAKDVKLLQSSPGPMTNQITDRLERAARVTGKVSPFFGSETTGSLRTGRAIDALGGFAIDPNIQEVQEIGEFMLAEVNEAVMAVEKAYFGDDTIEGFTGFFGDRELVSYQPNKIFETPHNQVAYAFPGADVSQMSVGILQLVGGDLMSKATARTKHPMIQDADHEEHMLDFEAVTAALRGAVQQGVLSGQMQAEDVGMLAQRILTGQTLVEAWLAQHKAAQERQAQEQAAAPAGPGGEAGPGAAPSPGPAAGPAQNNARGILQGENTVPPPEGGLGDLRGLVRDLQTTAPR